MGCSSSKASKARDPNKPIQNGHDDVKPTEPLASDDDSPARLDSYSPSTSRVTRNSVSQEWQDFLNTLPVCPIHGCSHAFLAEFESGGQHGPHRLSGDDFNIGTLTTEVIKPFTTVKKGKQVEYLSYAELAFRNNLKDKRGQPAFCKEASHFVTHAWRYRFNVLVGALRNWLDQNSAVNEDEQYFWVDAFVVNQHEAQEYPMEWWSTRFAAAVGEVGSTIMIAEPWQDPLPLKRVWVIWEIYCTNQTGARLHIAMTRDTEEDFKQALTNSFEKVQSALSSVDVSTCVAYHKSHTDMVHEEIRRTIGFAKLNEMVSLRLTQWLIETGTILLMQKKKQTDDADAPALQEVFKLQDNLARMIRESGNPSVAETSFKELFREMEEKLGKDNASTLQCLNQLAVTLQKAKKPEEAFPLHQECYERRKRSLGDRHEDTLQSLSNLAVLLSEKRPMTLAAFEEARAFYALSVAGREATIGPDHPRTLYTVSNLAKLLTDTPERFDNKTGLFQEAEVMHERAATKLLEILKQGHPLTLGALHNQACHWVDRYVFGSDDQGSAANSDLLDKAIEQLQTVHSLRIQKLGNTHPDTMATERKLRQARAWKQNSRFFKDDTELTWKDMVPQQYSTLSTGPLFKKLRNNLRVFGITKLRDELVRDGYINPRGKSLSVGTQPFNIFARLSAGVQVQRKVPDEQSKLGPFADRYVIAHNKPECNEMWQRSDPTWLGKASMSKRHVFLLTQDLNWEHFNILTMGIDIRRAQPAVQRLEEMKQAAYHWVSQNKDWPSIERVGLYVVVYPFTNVPAFHVHIVDLDNIGPSFEKLSTKMLPLDDAIQVLRDECEVCPPIKDFVKVFEQCGPVAEAPGKEANAEILAMLDKYLPELEIYRDGEVKTSPGVVEIEGSPTEYYRTVGAILAFLGAYASAQGNSFGLDIATVGKRGPMSMDQVPGKFINMGNKPKEYEVFCKRFADQMQNEDDWWAMLVFLAVHDVGKSVKFCQRVNGTLPLEDRTDDHDRILACCLRDVHLTAELLPSVYKLSGDRHAKLLAGFATNFQLPQLGQGEVTVDSLKGLLDLPEEHLRDGTLKNYLYHSIFDIAGGPCNERFIYPLALVPVYIGFAGAMEELCDTLLKGEATKPYQLYTNFLMTNFKKAYPEFEQAKFKGRCSEDHTFLKGVGLVILRILALTRNTYKNPEKLLSLLESGSFESINREMSGTAGAPQIMLYYGPDLLRMGLGEDMKDETGENISCALKALEKLFRLVREECRRPEFPELEQYDLNVQPMVMIVKKFGKHWNGGKQLLEVAEAAKVKSMDHYNEGILDTSAYTLDFC